MTDVQQFLDQVDLFAGLTPEDRHAIAGMGIEKQWAAGTVIYHEGDPGESMFLVVEGSVEILTHVGDGTERPLLTVRPGSGFGLLALIDAQPRAATARAIAGTRTLEIARAGFADFISQNPSSRASTLYALAAGLARQSRIAFDLLRQNLAWTLEASGAAHLNLTRLITDRVHLTADLVNGHRLSGTLLKIEPSAAGYELLLKTDGDQICMVPYHAVVSLSFASGASRPVADSSPDL